MIYFSLLKMKNAWNKKANSKKTLLESKKDKIIVKKVKKMNTKLMAIINQKRLKYKKN